MTTITDFVRCSADNLIFHPFDFWFGVVVLRQVAYSSGWVGGCITRNGLSASLRYLQRTVEEE